MTAYNTNIHQRSIDIDVSNCMLIVLPTTLNFNKNTSFKLDESNIKNGF